MRISVLLSLLMVSCDCLPSRILDNPERALGELENALKTCDLSDPQRLRALSMMVRCCIELKRLDAARPWLEQARAIQVTPPPGVDPIGLAWIRSEDRLQYARQAIEGMDRIATDAYANMKVAIAVALLRQAADLWTGADPFARLRLADVLTEWAQVLAFTRGNDRPVSRQEAIHKLQQAIELCDGSLWRAESEHIKEKCVRLLDSLRR